MIDSGVGRRGKRVGVLLGMAILYCFFFSSRRRHTRWNCDWSSDVCSSDLPPGRRYPVPMIEALSVPAFAAPYAPDDATLLRRYLAETRLDVAAEARIDARASGFIEAIRDHRSEERRVGKEGRSRGESYDER